MFFKRKGKGKGKGREGEDILRMLFRNILPRRYRNNKQTSPFSGICDNHVCVNNEL